jgi:hypothetical protein
MDLVKEMQSLKRVHYTCEDDNNYSCPLSKHAYVYEGPQEM